MYLAITWRCPDCAQTADMQASWRQVRLVPNADIYLRSARRRVQAASIRSQGEGHPAIFRLIVRSNQEIDRPSSVSSITQARSTRVASAHCDRGVTDLTDPL